MDATIAPQPGSAPAREDRYVRRGRLYAPAKGKPDRPLPRITPRVFLAERDRAFAPDAPTGAVLVDNRAALALEYPATTPVMLARYVVVRAGEAYEHDLTASGEVYYACQGSGRSSKGAEAIDWREGDVFCLPGGGATRHEAHEAGVLYLVTNEPELAFAGLPAPRAGQGKVEAALFPGEAIDRELLGVERGQENGVTSEFVSLSLWSQDAMRSIIPSLTVSVNSLMPGTDQRPHRHIATALTLGMECDGVWSNIDHVRHDWSRHAVVLIPPMAEHEHHNDGGKLMKALVVQDGGLFHNCRTFIIEYPDQPS